MKKFLLAFILTFSTLYSDEIRPAYLEINEVKTNHFETLLKLPANGFKRPPIELILPSNCQGVVPLQTDFVSGSYIDRWQLHCKEGLQGKTLSFEGLGKSKTDVLLRLSFLNGVSESVILNASNKSYTIAQENSWLQIVQTYTFLGVEHILLGFDHLLFVFALLLIVKSMGRLLWTITAFTLAHSITMICATLELISLPSKPVEAIIALSILFLAMEIIHERQGKAGLTSQYPWLIAFIFGLLHGFGFAGALAEIGLPQYAVTTALLFFNIGVEVGQIIFVLVVVVFALILQKLNQEQLIGKLKVATVYFIGGLSSFWLIERVI